MAKNFPKLKKILIEFIKPNLSLKDIIFNMCNIHLNIESIEPHSIILWIQKQSQIDM